jgi:RNA polymerase sigma factor (sigma-70 family)
VACDDQEMLRRVKRALRRLPPRRRNIFLLVRVDGLTYAEVGEQYRIPAERVQQIIAEVTWALRQETEHGRPLTLLMRLRHWW